MNKNINNNKSSDKIYDETKIKLIIKIKNNSSIYPTLERKFKNDYDITYTAINKNGLNIQHAPEKFRKNKELVRLAVSSNPLAYEFADKSLRSDKLFLISLLNENVTDSRLLSYINYKFLFDKDVAQAFIVNDAECFKYLPEELRNNDDILSIAVKLYGKNLQFINKEHKYELTCLDAIENDPSSYEFLPDEMKNDLTFMRMAAIRNGLILKYANDRIKNDLITVKYAIKNNIKAKKYIGKTLKPKIKENPFILT